MTSMYWEGWRALKTLYTLIQDLMRNLHHVSYNSTLWIGSSGINCISMLEIEQTETKIVVKAEMPHIAAEDLEIRVFSEMVSISGERRVFC